MRLLPPPLTLAACGRRPLEAPGPRTDIGSAAALEYPLVLWFPSAPVACALVRSRRELFG